MEIIIIYPAYWIVIGVILALVVLVEGLKSLYFEICVVLAIMGLIRLLIEWSCAKREVIAYTSASTARRFITFLLIAFKCIASTCLVISYYTGLDGILRQGIFEIIAGVIGFVVCLVIFVPDIFLTMLKSEAGLTGTNICDFAAGVINTVIFVIGNGNW